MTSARHPRKHELDVRPLLARGEEPFGRIMAMVNQLQKEDELILLSPFLPSPLIERLRSQGFQAHPEIRPDGSWRTHFRQL